MWRYAGNIGAGDDEESKKAARLPGSLHDENLIGADEIGSFVKRPARRTDVDQLHRMELKLEEEEPLGATPAVAYESPSPACCHLDSVRCEMPHCSSSGSVLNMVNIHFL